MKRSSFKGLAGLALGAGLVLSTLPTPALAAVVPMTVEQKEATDGNYWAELNAYENPSLSQDGDGFIIPTYLNDYFATSKVNWAIQNTGFFDSATLYVPGGVGIHADGTMYDEYDAQSLEMFKFYSLEEGDENWRPHKQPADPALNHWQNGRQWIPYGWNPKSDLLWNVKDQNIYGDLSESGASSTAVATHKRGDAVNLTLSLDASVFRNWANTMLVSSINSEFPAVELMKRDTPETGLTSYDSELVFVLDLPEGLEATESTAYQLAHLDGFTLSTTKENDGKRLVIRARINQPENGYIALKELYRKINEAPLDSIALDVSGLKVSDSAPFDTTLTATGYAYGAFEHVVSSENDAIINRDNSVDQDDHHYFWHSFQVFAAKQGDATRDAAADPAKPNLMTYSFQVPAPALHAVTFVSDGAEVAKVNVEDGKGIATDGLADQSMPADPTKDGYTFKGWNTAADGTGEAFTGETAVGSDMTVYAVFEKTSAPAQPSKPAKPARKVEKLPQTGDASLLAASAVTAAAGGAVLLASWKTRDKS